MCYTTKNLAPSVGSHPFFKGSKMERPKSGERQDSYPKHTSSTVKQGGANVMIVAAE